MADAHDDESGAPPVTICCAASDGAAVREAAEALVARGHQVELALGVDADTAVLTRAIARLRGRGLYVLCRSHALDRNAVDLLREILRTHDVPFGRTLTLAVDTQRPREVEERIVSVLRRMVTGRADGRPKAWGTNTPMHEEDPDTTVRKPGGAMGVADPQNVLVGLGEEPENADPYASTSQIEVRFHEGEAMPPAPYTGVERTAVGPAPQGPAAAASMPSLPSPMSMPAAPIAGPMAASMPAAPIPTPVPAPMPVMPMGGGASSMSGPLPLASASTSGPLASASVSMPVSPMFSPGMPPIGSSPAMSDALTAYTPPPVSADDSADFDELTTGGRMGRALGSPAGLALIIGGLVVVVLAVVAAFMLGRDDEGDARAAAATADDAASKAAEAKRRAEAESPAKGGAEKADGDAKADEDATADDAKADAKADDDAKADAEADADAKAADAKADDAKADDAKADADAKTPDAKTPVPETPDPEPEPALDPGPAPDLASPSGRPRWAAAADPGDPLPSRSFAPQDDPPEVVAALRSREVRALDVFLVAPERKGTLTYDQAVTYCQTLEVAKLTGWRVPSIGELNSMASAKMLGKAIFWSMTPGDSFGDLRLVLGAKKAITIVAVPKGWDGAKIVCIRPRQP